MEEGEDLCGGDRHLVSDGRVVDGEGDGGREGLVGGMWLGMSQPGGCSAAGMSPLRCMLSRGDRGNYLGVVGPFFGEGSRGWETGGRPVFLSALR